ncbi:MAG: serine/threonine protein kinase, partial [Clostridiales bacterium]|nr:serine/threonine protein kinase [Clostridiales bacterium]
MREKDGGRLFVQKILQGRHRIYSEIMSNPHPYLPALYEVEIADGETVVIEEYIEGPSLGSAELSEKQILSSRKELCVVLEFLHGKDIIHRDVKPSNIILAQDGHIRLIDFDAARTAKEDVEQDTRLLGTRGYAPPEQYGFSQTDTRSDVYSLGVTLRQLLGGKANKLRYKKIVRKCTDLNPDRRYQSAGRVRNALPDTKRSVLCVAAIVVLAVVILQSIPYLPLLHGEPGTALTVLPTPTNPHWNGETGIAVWDNVLQSGSGGSQ